MILTQEKVVIFTRNVPFFMFVRFKTARMEIVKHIISVGAHKKSACKNSHLPSNANNFSARRCLKSGGHSNQCISNAKPKEFLYKTHNINGFAPKIKFMQQKVDPVWRLKRIFTSGFLVSLSLIIGASDFPYERFPIVKRKKTTGVL